MFHHWTSLSPYLTETLSCSRVTYFLLCPRLMAVTWSAVRVTIETRGAAVTLTSDNIVFASKQKIERNIKVNPSSVTRRQNRDERFIF